MRKSLFRRLGYGVSATLVAALVLVAVSMSLLRVAVAYAPQLRGEVERVLAQALNRPLTLGGMRAAWAGRHPRLILEDVRLTGDAPLSGLEVPELEVDVDLLGSLRTMRLQLAQVAVTGLEVQVRYADDGSLHVAKIGNAELQADALFGGGGGRQLPARVQLRDATVHFDDLQAGRVHRLNPVDLELSSLGRGGYYLAGYVPLPDTLGRSVRFRAEWRGQPDHDDFAGKLYVDARLLRLQSMSSLLLRLAPLPPLQGTADAQLWVDLDERGAEQVTGQLSLSDAAIQNAEDVWQTVAGHLKGGFLWQRHGSGWDLMVDELLYASAYRVWPRTDLKLRFDRRGAARTLQLQAGYLHVGDLASIVGSLPITPAGIREHLERSAPTGELLTPQLSLRWSGDGIEGYGARARFQNAGFRPVDKAPGMRGIDGEIEATEAGGVARIRTEQGELSFVDLFRDPIRFQALQTELFWRIEPESWTLEAPVVSVRNSDARVRARLRVIGDVGASPFIDLRARLENGDGRSVSRYLPVGIMPPQLVKWLDNAIIGGNVPAADVVMFGRATDFPFVSGNGVFDVRADVTDAELRYKPDWPALESVAGRLRFSGDSMAIDVSRGRVAGAAVQQARITIDDVRRAPLSISGALRGTGQQLLGFLHDSPLGASIREQLARMRLSGTHDVALSATIPLHDEQELAVQGSVALDKADYRVPDWGLALDGLQGTVQFNERGIEADRITARYHGIPAVLRATTAVRGGAEQIRVVGRIRATPAALLDKELPTWIDGATDWEVQLALPGFQMPRTDSKPVLDFRVDSRLDGVAVDLPAPFGKTAGAARPLQLSTRIRDGGIGPVRLTYGDDVRAVLALSPEGVAVARAGIWLGSGEPALPRRGLAVHGRIPRLDLDGWRPRLSPGVEASATTAGGLSLSLIDVHIDDLRVMGQTFPNTAVRVQPSAAGWIVTLDGPAVAGDIALPQADGPVVARMDRIWLQPPTTESGRAKDAETTSAASESGLPALDVVVADLRMRDQPFGRLDLVTRKTEAGTTIELAKIDGPLAQVTVEGGWQRALSRSQLRGNLKGSDTGRLLYALGYADAMRGGKVDVSMDVSWEGRLLDFALPRLLGSLDMTIRDGQILAVEPGAGRLFGLLSVTELPRRLSLDFSDLFGKGFAFERIVARFELAEGDAHTRQFYMQGPSARVDLKGRIGLAARDYDQEVTVTPNVSTALPALGAVAGGPVGAVAGLVTQKLLEKELNKLSRFTYRVEGSWDEPQIEPVGEAPETADRRDPTESGSVVQ